jgi:hypothetical protein
MAVETSGSVRDAMTLAAYRSQNQLDLALWKLRWIERTLFTLDWLELLTAVPRRSSFVPPALNLVIAATEFWNSTYIAAQLRAHQLLRRFPVAAGRRAVSMAWIRR